MQLMLYLCLTYALMMHMKRTSFCFVFTNYPFQVELRLMSENAYCSAKVQSYLSGLTFEDLSLYLGVVGLLAF